MSELFFYIGGFWLLCFAYVFSETYPDEQFITEREIREFPGDVSKWLRDATR